jgi:hypothetical protein
MYVTKNGTLSKYNKSEPLFAKDFAIVKRDAFTISESKGLSSLF